MDPISTTKKVSLGGLKLSEESVLVKIIHQNGSGLITGITNRFTEHEVNIAFLTQCRLDDVVRTDICYSAKNEALARELIRNEIGDEEKAEFKNQVGLISIYPTSYRPMTLGLVLRAFHENNLNLHGWATSLSSLVLVSDYNAMDRAVSALGHYFEWPHDHAPFRPFIRITQSRILEKD